METKVQNKANIELRHNFWYLNLVLALLGLGVSFILTYKHFSGNFNDPICNFSEKLNCDFVLNSRFAKWGFIPLGGIGVVFYLYIFTQLLRTKISHTKVSFLAIPYLSILLACVVSLLLAYESSVNLNTYCPYCIALYVVNFLLAIFMPFVLGFNLKQWAQNLKQAPWLSQALWVVIIFGIGFSVYALIDYQKRYDISGLDLTVSKEDKVKQEVDKILEMTAFDIDSSSRPYWGNPDAEITIVEFSDFQCPYCKKAAEELKPLLEDFRSDIKLVYMFYPLDKSCNPFFKGDLHSQACGAAFSAHCADQQGQFWPYHDLLFANQTQLSQVKFLELAQSLNLDMEKFKQCMAAPATKERIVADIKEGQKAKMQGTPTILVNGKLMNKWRSQDHWYEIFERLMSKNPS